MATVKSCLFLLFKTLCSRFILFFTKTPTVEFASTISFGSYRILASYKLSYIDVSERADIIDVADCAVDILDD